MNLSIEIIDKRNDTITKVSEDYKIEHDGLSISLKDLQYKDMKVFGVIIQENGEIDFCYKKEVKIDEIKQKRFRSFRWTFK